MSDSIRTIAVVGDGIAAVTAAAALAARLPGVRVALVRHPARTTAMVDRVASTTPAALPFHADMGWDWRDVLRHGGGAIRLGTQVDGPACYVHAYGAAGGGSHAAASLTALWARHPARPYHDYVAGARLGLARKVPTSAPALASAVFGLHLDPARYLAALEGYARHRGVMVAAARLADVTHDGDRVTALHLDDGSYLTADLYVDATGQERRLQPAAHTARIDWNGWFPFRHLMQQDHAAEAALPSLDRMTIAEDRLVLHHHLPDRTPELVLDRAPRDGAVALSFGRAERGWIDNTVAVGEAHVALPPVEALPFHWLHTGIDRIIALLPGRDAAQVEQDHYNRTANEEADRLLDLALAHWPIRPESPPALVDTVTQFARRLRWRQRDGEGFARDDWAQILFGRGVRPALLEPAAPDEDRLLATIAAELDIAVAAAPDHRRFLREISS